MKQKERGVKGDPWQSVTDQEKELSLLMASGLTTKGMADSKKKLPGTIRMQIHFMRTKYNCSNSTQLVAEFLRRKIIE